MSITFGVEGAQATTVECPTCGGLYGESQGVDGCPAEMAEATSSCYGMGFTILSSPEMNVSNTNAFLILGEILGYGEGEFDYCGSLDPEDVLRRLATAQPVTRAGRDNNGVSLSEAGVSTAPRIIMCGVSPAQAQSYIDRMTAIAVAARFGSIIGAVIAGVAATAVLRALGG